MGKHLWKDGKRHCYRCKSVLPLTKNYFDSSKKGVGFRYECKKCPRNFFRIKLISLRGNKCESCGIKNSNPSFFDVHHIIPVKRKKMHMGNPISKKDYPLLNVLCPNCHRKITISKLEFIPQRHKTPSF